MIVRRSRGVEASSPSDEAVKLPLDLNSEQGDSVRVRVDVHPHPNEVRKVRIADPAPSERHLAPFVHDQAVAVFVIELLVGEVDVHSIPRKHF